MRHHRSVPGGPQNTRVMGTRGISSPTAGLPRCCAPWAEIRFTTYQIDGYGLAPLAEGHRRSLRQDPWPRGGASWLRRRGGTRRGGTRGRFPPTPGVWGQAKKASWPREGPARTESEDRLNSPARHGSGGDDVTTRAPLWQTRLRIRASIGDRARPAASQRPGPRPPAERKCYEDS